MFERFSDDARQAVAFASDEARELGHGRIGTEHLLLGLLRGEDTTAGETLAALGIRIDAVRAEVVTRVAGREAPHTGPAAAQPPFTPRAKKVLELSLREALALGRNEIDTEHVLLGLARENAGIASRILDDLGAGAERIRAETLARRPQARERRRQRRKPWALSSATRWQYRIEDATGPIGEERLDELGEEGWELVAVLPAEAGGGLVFKRPRRLIRAREEPPPEPDPAA